MYIYMYVHCHTYTYLFIYILLHILIHRHTYSFIYVRLHICTLPYLWILVYLDTFTHTDLYTYILVHINSYMYIKHADFLRHMRMQRSCLRAAAGPERAAVFVQHCVTRAPEHQSSPADPPCPHTLTHTHSSLFQQQLCFLSFPDRFLLWTLSLLPPAALHNFHSGGTRGFLIACLWKHSLVPPSLQTLGPAVCFPTNTSAHYCFSSCEKLKKKKNETIMFLLTFKV